MRSVSRKNIDPILSDIKIPKKEGDLNSVKPLIDKNLSQSKFGSLSKIRKLNYRISFAVIALIFATSLLGSFYVFKITELKKAAHLVFDQLRVSVKETKGYFKNRDFKNAANELGSLNTSLASIHSRAKNFGLFHLSVLLGNFWDTAKTLPTAFLSIEDLGKTVFEVFNDLDFLESNALGLMFNKRGNELISLLKNIDFKITKINEINLSLKNQFSILEKSKLGLGNLSIFFSNSYLENAPALYEVQDFLQSLIAFLNKEGDINVLVLFQNSSEIRPAGGFLGSLANAVLNKGSLMRFDVSDIYDLDGQLDLKIVPPLALQSITPSWGARDANWFFDFRTSAQKVRYFLENSKIYKERNLKFPVVLAINDSVLKNILALSGDIFLKDYNLTINQFNFLPLIQEEVEAGKDKRAGHPKRILKVLSPILLEKIKNFDGNTKKKLLANIEFHLKNKDIMIYFDDLAMEDFIKSKGFAGDVYEENIKNGDYLAVVNANIAGGKSDMLIDADIDFISQLTLDGDLKNNLIIRRTHNGNTRKESWYRALNQDFIKIFTAEGSKFGFIEGNARKSLSKTSGRNLAKDYDLIKIEEGKFMEESNVWITKENKKTVFSFWFNVASGESKTLKLDYYVPRAFSLGEKNYKFVFDKQSGVRGELRIALVAPLGFKWKESGSEYFEYEARNPEARVVLELNLEKK